MNTIINITAEDEILLLNIIEIEKWYILPAENVFYNALKDIEIYTEEKESKKIMSELIVKLQQYNYIKIKKYLWLIKCSVEELTSCIDYEQ